MGNQSSEHLFLVCASQGIQNRHMHKHADANTHTQSFHKLLQTVIHEHSHVIYMHSIPPRRGTSMRKRDSCFHWILLAYLLEQRTSGPFLFNICSFLRHGGGSRQRWESVFRGTLKAAEGIGPLLVHFLPVQLYLWSWKSTEPLKRHHDCNPLHLQIHTQTDCI